jgi:hypothetical protein
MVSRGTCSKWAQDQRLRLTWGGAICKFNLESDVVAGNSSETFVPEPLGRFDGLFHTGICTAAHQIFLLFWRGDFKHFRVPGTEDENIAGLEFDALGLCDCFDLGNRDVVTAKGVEFDAVGIGIPFEVDENPTANEAPSVVPICGDVNCVDQKRVSL